MISSFNSLSMKWVTAFVGCASMALWATQAQTQPLPPSTAIPIVFTHSIAAGQSKPGDKVTAKTIQSVFLSNGRVLPAGSALAGHIVQSNSFALDQTPYAIQKPSVLAIHFDTIGEGPAQVSVSLAVRAIAGSVASHEAEIPHYRDEIDATGTRTEIGGASFSPLEEAVTSPNGDVVGYSRKQGVFARLLAAESVNQPSSLHCDATDSEQSVAIFSADACGVYGLNTVSLVDNGAEDHGAFVLESRRETVKVDAGSTALLQVMAQ